ncbi:MAG TPA: hypothetical protein DC013_01530 [Ruminococcaceae bacterium]|jgi:hypothetical protein|nr:hypothetical protein [Oscillospiraceae bacterium]
MPDYKKMYFQLSAKIADAVDILVKAQRQGEKDYMEEEFPVFSLTQKKHKMQTCCRIFPGSKNSRLLFFKGAGSFDEIRIYSRSFTLSLSSLYM